MSHLCLLAGVTSLTLTSMGFAGSTTADLQARLDAAEARIAELSAAQNQDWLSESRADEIRGLVHDVLADADTRASLQGDGASAGYNGGFTVGSGDGSYSLTINGVLQQRWVHSDVDDGGDADDGFDEGLTALQFSGSVGGDYGYDMRLHYDSTGGNWDLAWGYGTVDMGDGMTLSMGDMKVPLNREWMTNAEHQLGMDRSWVGSQNNWRSNARGISLDWGGDSNNWTVQYGNGEGTDGWNDNDNSYRLTVRGDWLLSGNWGDFDDFTVGAGESSATAVGVAWSNHDAGDTGDDQWDLGVDLSMNWDGSGLYVAVSYNDDDGSDANAMGWVAQWSTWLNSDWELYVRYESYDADTADDTDDAEIWGIGVNQYWAGHNAKWTTEIGMTDGIPSANGDWLASDDDQMLLRTQLQFAF